MLAALLVFGFSIAIIAFAKPKASAADGVVRGFHLDRPAGAVLGALGMVLCKVLPPAEALGRAINYDTLLLLFGMMVICAYLVEARVFRTISYLTLMHVSSARTLLVAVVAVAGLLSAVLVNDTVCLMVTPLVLQCCRDAKLPPLPYLLAVCFGANAGSVATPTGNPQNMIIGTLSGIPYAKFVLALGGPALISLVMVALCLLVLFRKQLPRGPLPRPHLERPPLDAKLAALCAVVLVVLLVGFFAGYSLSWTALLGAGLLLLLGRRTPRRLLEQVDYVLLVFFAGLFVIVYAVGKVGLAELLFQKLRPFLGSQPLPQSLLFGIFTAVLSQLVSNVPFVLLASSWMPLFADPQLMWLSTAMFATLAGNLTIVGSVANIIVLESAGKDGHIGFWQFFKYGGVVTLLTTLAAFFLLYLERTLGLF